MKKITLLFAAFMFVTASNAQLQEEGFSKNTIPSGWTIINTSGCSWQFGYMGIMPGSGGAGNEAEFPSGAAFFDDSICGALSKDRTILTGPTEDLSGVTNIEIEVVYNLQVFGDKGEFIIEVFDGTSWQQVYFQNIDTPRNTGENQTVTLDVSTHINSEFAVRFIYDDEGISAVGLGIDNYKLSNTSTASIDQLADFGFKYYPNPVTNVLKLNSKENIEKINIYNILGQEVMHEKPSRTSTQIDMSNLPMGTYIAQIEIDNRIGTIKILKQ